MKRILFFLVVLLSVWSVAYADQTLNGRQPREWRHSTSESAYLLGSGQGRDYSDNTTVYTNLATVGNNATGNASYLVLTAVDNAGNVFTYYLWMDATTTTYGTAGALKYASFSLMVSNPTVYTSFPYGDWRNSTGFTSGYTVTARNLKQ